MQVAFFERVLVFSVDEANASENVFQVRVTSEFSPAFGRTLSELEHRRQRSFCRAATLGLSLSESGCGERAFDRGCRANVTPVLRREIVEREQFRAVFFQALGGLKVLRFERVQEQVEGFVGVGACQMSCSRRFGLSYHCRSS